MHLAVSLACSGGRAAAKISGERCLKERGGGREGGRRGTKWVSEMVAVIRWCYLGAGRCVWHNLKLEIAVSISPHSVATRSTDNKSGLILLKISRECSGGGDERQWERRKGRGEEGKVGGGGGEVTEEDKRPKRRREEADWRSKETRKHLRGEKVLPEFDRISAAHLPIISPDRFISANQAPPSI